MLPPTCSFTYFPGKESLNSWTQVEKLLEQYDNMAVELPEAGALQEKHAAAAAWAAQAQKALDRPQPFRDEDAARLQVWCYTQN